MATCFVFRAALFSLCLSVCSLSAEAADRKACRTAIKVGVSIPLTAGAISSGAAVRDSILLADEKYDTSQCVEFLFEDDQLLAKNTLANVDKFINVHHVNAFIIYGTPTSIAVGHVVEQHKIPMIALSILDKVVHNKKFIMKHWCSAERLHETLRKEVVQRHYKSVAIVSTQNDAMLGLRDLYLQSRISGVVVNDEFVRDENDFRSSVAKIVTKNPDAVYVLLYPPQTAVFMKQLRAQNYRGAAFGVHNIEDPAELQAARGAMDGMWFVNGDGNAGQNYAAEFSKRFDAPTAVGGANGFDAAKMLIEASQQTLDINDYLHGLKNFHGAFGIYDATANNDFDFPAVVKVTKGERFQGAN